LVEIDGVVYFQNYKDKSKLYSFDLKTRKMLKLTDDFVKELVTDGEYLYYRNRNDGRIYRINKDGSDRKQISKEAGSSIFIYDEYIYYTSPDGISRMKKDGQDAELLYKNTKEDLFFYDIFVYNGTIYFSGGAGLGIYYLDDSGEETEVNVLYFDEAYDIHVLDGYIYFNIFKQHISANRQIPMYRYDLDEKNYNEVSDINLNSSAYYIYDKYLYMDGYVRSTSGLKKDQGLYRIDTETGESILLIDRRSTDIYVSESYIYSYTSDNGGSLVAYDINDVKKTIVIF
jgi:outer membrane protein assembly factor BamB